MKHIVARMDKGLEWPRNISDKASTCRSSSQSSLWAEKDVENLRLQITDNLFLANFSIFFLSDLRFNHIKEVPTDAFKGLTQLHSIFLNDNQITTLQPGAFRGLPSLRFLYLNQNHIRSIASSAFANLTRLERLWVDFVIYCVVSGRLIAIKMRSSPVDRSRSKYCAKIGANGRGNIYWFNNSSHKPWLEK